MTKANDDTATYAPFFKAWAGKLAGSKPTADMLHVAHAFGKPGKQSLALAMAMRPEGVTGAQIALVCSNPQNNHRRGLLEAALMKRVAMPKTAQGHTVYKVELTAKGKQALDRATARAAKVEAEGAADKPVAKAGKAKGAAKVKRAAKGTAPVTPASDAPSAPQVPAPVDGDAQQAQA